MLGIVYLISAAPLAGEIRLGRIPIDELLELVHRLRTRQRENLQMVHETAGACLSEPSEKSAITSGAKPVSHRMPPYSDLQTVPHE